jgi:hypothetical protein
MPHQMKGIGDGRQDVCLILLDTWRTMQKHSDQVSMECFIFVVLYEDCYTSQLKLHLVAARSNNDVFNIVSFKHYLQVDFSWNLIIL